MKMDIYHNPKFLANVKKTLAKLPTEIFPVKKTWEVAHGVVVASSDEYPVRFLVFFDHEIWTAKKPSKVKKMHQIDFYEIKEPNYTTAACVLMVVSSLGEYLAWQGLEFDWRKVDIKVH